MRQYLFITILVLFGCGSGGSEGAVNVIDFAPNPSKVVSGKCSSKAQLVSISSDTVTLTGLTAQFSDTAGHQATFQMTIQEIEAAAGTVVITGSGVLVLPVTFDFNSTSLTLPATGAVIVMGSFAGGFTQFIGSLKCEA